MQRQFHSRATRTLATAATRTLAAAATRTLAAAAVLLLAAGCSTYTARLADLKPRLAAGSYDEALATLEKSRKGKDELLYLLERGLILHHAGRREESNEAFEAAEILAEDLYTRSLSEGALSLMLNDNTISYRARPFEMAMIPYYRALNYIALGRPGDALVEARKASLYLRQYSDLTFAALEGEELERSDWLGNSAFLHYFSGMLYEWDGEVNDAFIAYRNAAAAYRASSGALALDPPVELGGDVERTGRALGFREEVAFVRESYPEIFSGELSGERAPGEGEVVVLLEYGFVPQRVETRIIAPLFDSDDASDADGLAAGLALRTGQNYVAPSGVDVIYWLSVAMPQMRSQRPPVARAAVRAAGAGAWPATTRTVADLEGRALATFEAERAKILIKTLARGLTKYLTQRAADKQGKGLGLLAGIFNIATETADTRGWLTLPNTIGMARLSLPAGVHDLEVDLLDAAGNPAGRIEIPGVAVRAGDWTFVVRRVW